MSTAVLERIVEKPVTAAARVSPPAMENEPADPHPLVPVFIAGAISLALSGLFIGTILILLALQNSGVMAP
ncbi:MAG TPA: hypothetical protein VFT65_01330 [Candidatus Angelobacter sp.]|nr:hypothetical protein [Candidatus Angelobacter sp.]